MYLKDGEVFVKVDGGFQRVIPSISDTGSLILKKDSSTPILKKKPLGAKPVVGREIIAQLNLEKNEHSAVSSSGSAHTQKDDDDDLPLTKSDGRAVAQHTATRVAKK